MNKETKLPQNLSVDTQINEQLLHFFLQDGILTTSEIENYIIMSRKNKVTKFTRHLFIKETTAAILLK